MSLDVILMDEVCQCCGRGDEVYASNITHNLTEMAEAAGIYYALWRPEEKGWINAKDIVEVLEEGLGKLKGDPEKYERYNSPNGWGTYKHFVPFVQEYLEACRKYPEAYIEASR